VAWKKATSTRWPKWPGNATCQGCGCHGKAGHVPCMCVVNQQGPCRTRLPARPQPLSIHRQPNSQSGLLSFPNTTSIPTKTGKAVPTPHRCSAATCTWPVPELALRAAAAFSPVAGLHLPPPLASPGRKPMLRSPNIGPQRFGLVWFGTHHVHQS